MTAALPELLAPVGDMKRLAVALRYGADAVYLAGKKLGMRAACKNFDGAELAEAARIVHAAGKKLYVTVNIFPYDTDLDGIADYIAYLEEIGVDGVIVSDLGLIRRITTTSRLPVHVSTQANVMNYDTAAMYADLGVKRIVLARELSLDRIAALRTRLDRAVGLEAFVHGAMCISYSGRCLLSAYLTGRSANRGECNQACRMMFTPENTAEPLEFVEDGGTYIFGGNDLNMVEHLAELRDAGVDAFKIEGRVKSEYYVGCVVNAYRKALDALAAGEPVPDYCYAETQKAPNRGFNTGFYYGPPVHSTDTPPYCDFCGIVVGETDAGCVVEMRNRFRTGDLLEVLAPEPELLNTVVTVPQMLGADGSVQLDAKVPCALYTLPGVRLTELSMLRRPANTQQCKNACK